MFFFKFFVKFEFAMKITTIKTTGATTIRMELVDLNLNYCQVDIFLI